MIGLTPINKWTFIIIIILLLLLELLLLVLNVTNTNLKKLNFLLTKLVNFRLYIVNFK